MSTRYRTRTVQVTRMCTRQTWVNKYLGRFTLFVLFAFELNLQPREVRGERLTEINRFGISLHAGLSL